MDRGEMLYVGCCLADAPSPFAASGAAVCGGPPGRVHPGEDLFLVERHLEIVPLFIPIVHSFVGSFVLLLSFVRPFGKC